MITSPRRLCLVSVIVNSHKIIVNPKQHLLYIHYSFYYNYFRWVKTILIVWLNNIKRYISELYLDWQKWYFKEKLSFIVRMFQFFYHTCAIFFLLVGVFIRCKINCSSISVYVLICFYLIKGLIKLFRTKTILRCLMHLIVLAYEISFVVIE